MNVAAQQRSLVPRWLVQILGDAMEYLRVECRHGTPVHDQPIYVLAVRILHEKERPVIYKQKHQESLVKVCLTPFHSEDETNQRKQNEMSQHTHTAVKSP